MVDARNAKMHTLRVEETLRRHLPAVSVCMRQGHTQPTETCPLGSGVLRAFTCVCNNHSGRHLEK